MIAPHPDPGGAVVAWLREVAPGWVIDRAVPDRPGARYVVAATTVSATGQLGATERWSVALQVVAPESDRDEAVALAARVCAAGRALNAAPVVRTWRNADGEGERSFALTRCTASGPEWQSAEVAGIGRIDRAVAGLVIQARIYP